MNTPTKARLRWLVGGALVAVLAGCTTGISVRPAHSPSLLDDWRASAVENGDLSPRTQQTLRRLDLADPYRRNPAETFTRLHNLAVQNEEPDLLFALAEIAYHLGLDAERQENGEALACYYLCAGYAYHYLFGGKTREAGPEKKVCPACHPAEEAFDPRFRLACDLYNAGLAKCLRTAQKAGRLDMRRLLHMPALDGCRCSLSVIHQGFAWRPEEFGPVLFCSDYQVVGLSNYYRGYGLGVPLIGIRAPDAGPAPAPALYPREASFPVTAFFRFEGSLADLGARKAGRLELYNPLAVHEVRVRGRPVPLETDLTTPLAYCLSRAELDTGEYTGFFRADSLRDRSGIYLFEPYQPGKIPVLLVHGLLSSPVTWAPLFNDLRADPELNARYQFWFYRYPTGDPYLATAADLRQSLERLRQTLDPDGKDPALGRMVVVGHSMGGLIGKLVSQDSGEDFWHLVSMQPFDQLKAEQSTRDELRPVFFFRRESCVQRVVFIGTPHHGSKLAPSLPARLLVRLVRLPQKLNLAAADLMREDPELWKDKGGKGVPTSIDLLSPSSPALELLAARTAPTGVVYHSIIGRQSGEGMDGGDGIVPYASAHIDGVASELVVPASHCVVHHHPRAVLEVCRILREHARSANRLDPEVVPVAAPAGPLSPVPGGR
jgi:pimeloyl-ACP methyl ester carboxylesterase